MPAARWASTGCADGGDAARAGSAAASSALDGHDDAALLVVFASDRLDPGQLLAGIGAVAGDVPLVGCSTAGEISADGPGDGQVVVFAFGGPGFTVSTACADVADAGSLRAAGEQVALCVEDVADQPNRVLLLLSDGLAGDQEELVRGAYGVLGAAVPLVGGCAGDDQRMERTTQLHGRRALTNSVVAAAIGSTSPLGIGIGHGWQRVGEPMLVTSSEGNRVYRLDEEPALDVYLRRLDAPAETYVDAAAFTRFASTHPLGLSRRRSDDVRFVAGADFRDRSLACVAHVPQGTLTWLMEGDLRSVLDATDQACAGALAALAGAPALGMLAFDCIARRGVLGVDGVDAEVQRLHDQASGAAVAGFYTYGEIARTAGIGGFHNQTLVVLAVS